MQIKKGDKWLWLGAGSGSRYECNTAGGAYKIADMCYPDQMRAQRFGAEITVRVKDIENGN